jgi:hypothetical protein
MKNINDLQSKAPFNVDNETCGVDNETCGVDNGTCGVDNETCGVDNETCGVGDLGEKEINMESINPINIETIDDRKFNINETIITKNLKNESFNNKIGIIQEYNTNNNRYIVLFEDSNKLVAIKEENLDNEFDNIENID